jgi:hypothetical protein
MNPVISPQHMQRLLHLDVLLNIHRVDAGAVKGSLAAKGSYALTQPHGTWPALGKGRWYVGAWHTASPNPFRTQPNEVTE